MKTQYKKSIHNLKTNLKSALENHTLETIINVFIEICEENARETDPKNDYIEGIEQNRWEKSACALKRTRIFE